MRQFRQASLFWPYFFLFNFLLFIPGYVFEIMHTRFFPVEILNFKDFPQNLSLLISRENADIFRFHGEFYLLVFIPFMLGFNATPPPWFIRTGFFIFLICLEYTVYQGFSFGIYREPPHLTGDLQLLPETIDLLVFETTLNKSLLFLFYTLVGAVVFYGLYLLWFRMFILLAIIRKKPIHKNTFWIIGGLILIISLVQLKNLNYYNTVRWTSLQLGKNIQKVWKENHFISTVTPGNLKKNYPYSPGRLKEKPDIQLFFLESYGKLVATSPDYKSNYQQLTENLEENLASDGWHAMTNYSEAPISGGRSWLSFTSVTNGIKIDNHAQYLHLLDKSPNYPHLLRFFRKAGYTNYKLNPLHHSGKDIPVSFYKKYYAIDQWLQHDDFKYKGESYGWVGIPDQYTLNYFHDNFLATPNRPSMVFFLTLSGHTPWKDIPPLNEQWQEFNKGGNKSDSRGRRSIFQLPKKEHYWEAMAYQLKLFSAYIQNKAKDNSIIILIGDHQPPGITPPGRSLETPVHIISRNRKFLQNFKAYGFTNGLWAFPKKAGTIKHEGFYSMFMREFLRSYGEEGIALPDYLPGGIEGED